MSPQCLGLGHVGLRSSGREESPRLKRSGVGEEMQARREGWVGAGGKGELSGQKGPLLGSGCWHCPFSHWPPGLQAYLRRHPAALREGA